MAEIHILLVSQCPLSSLSPCPHCPVILIVLSSSSRPHHRPSCPIIVPLFPLPHCLVFVLFIITCSTHNPSCEQWLTAMGMGAGSFHCRHRPPPLPGLLVLAPLSCSSSLSLSPRPIVVPHPHPAAPHFHPTSSGSRAWLGALCWWWCLSHRCPIFPALLLVPLPAAPRFHPTSSGSQAWLGVQSW